MGVLVVKPPPNNLNAEKTLLGSLIVMPEMFNSVSGILTPDSFYRSAHQSIYKAIENLHRNDEPVDIVTLSAELERNKVDIPRTEIVNLASDVPSGANAEYHAKIVADKAHRRQGIIAAREAEQMFFDDSQDVIDIATNAQKRLELSVPTVNQTSDIVPDIYLIADEIIDGHEKEKPYLTTGFYKIDRHTKIRPGELTMIAADAGEGKTSLMLGMTRHMVKKGKRPLFLTLEMTKRSIIENIVAQELRLIHQDVIGSELSEADQVRLVDGVAKIANWNIGIMDSSFNTTQIRHQVMTEHRTKGIDCLFVDSLGRVKTEQKAERVNLAYNDICSDLVEIAKEFNIPVILAHHLNKNDGYRGKNRRPSLGSLNEAGERWTHNVLLVYRESRHVPEPTKEQENIAEVIIVKARDGMEGAIKLRWDGPIKTFDNLEEIREG